MLKLFLFSLTVSVALAATAGGHEHADTNSQDVQTMATFAVTSLNAQPSRHDVTLVNVLSAEKQVVAGMNYFLVLEVTGAGKAEICNVTVYDQSWTHTREVTSFVCHNKHKRQLGAVTVADVGSTEVQNAAQAAVVEINKGSNNMYASGLVRVIHATSQVVSGMKYRLEIATGQTNCRNTPTVDLSSCIVQENGMKSTCTVTVIFQAWVHPQYTIEHDFHCH